MPILAVAFARFIPALDEIVVHVGRRRTAQLQIDVVNIAVFARRMATCRNRSVVEIDAPDERDLIRVAGIDQPTLLVMAMIVRQGVPAGTELTPSLCEPFALVGGSRKVRALRNLTGAPEDNSHIDAAGDGCIEHIEDAAAPIGQLNFVLEEGDRAPDSPARSLDGLADPPKSRLAVDQGSDCAALSNRIAAF